MKLTLSVISGNNKGKTKDFSAQYSEPEIIVVGRHKDCGYSLSHDPYLSRHHFILDINPPCVLLRDLGSRNGTRVNDRRYGGRTKEESPGEAASRSTEVDIKNRDILKAGKTEILVRMKITEECGCCGGEITPEDYLDSKSGDGEFICRKCREKIQPVAPKVKEKIEDYEEPTLIKKKPGKLPEKPSKKTAEPAETKSKKPKKPVLIKGLEKFSQRFSADEQKKVTQDPASVIDSIIKGMLKREPGEKQDDKYPVIAGYRIVKELGKGGFGAVYLAVNNETGEKVALKTMLETKEPSERQRNMFEREIEVNRKLSHPNIISVKDYCVSNGIHYFALEYMDGGSLWDVMEKKRKLSLEEAVPVMIQSLEGLAFAHKQEIIHRDLKPPNILFSGQGENLIVKVSDFGLAKNFARAGMTKRAITMDRGGFCGSPPYMAPEHIKSYRFVKPPTDVFEIAATFYHMLTGEIIWDFTQDREALLVILEDKVKPIRDINRDIPWKLADVIDRSLSTKPGDRYKDAGEMLKAMRKAL